MAPNSTAMNASRLGWTGAAFMDPLTLWDASRGHLMRDRYFGRGSAGDRVATGPRGVVRAVSLSCEPPRPHHHGFVALSWAADGPRTAVPGPDASGTSLGGDDD